MRHIDGDRAGRSVAAFLGLVLVLASASALPAQNPFPLDERVTFQVGDVTARPGDTEVWVPFSIEIEPGGPPATDWYAALRFDPSVLAFAGEARWTSPRSLISHLPHPAAGGSELLLSSQSFNALDPRTHVTASELVELRFCVAESAAPGSHAIEILQSARCTHPRDPRLECSFDTQFYWEGEDPSEATNRTPAVRAGSLTVAGEPAGGGACPLPLAPGFIQRARLHDDVTFELGQVTASPGQADVSLPISVFLEPGAPRIGLIWCALRFDPRVVAPADRGWFSLEPAKSYCTDQLYQPDWFAEEGQFGCYIVFGHGEEYDPDPTPACSADNMLSSSNQGVVANLHFCVPEDAAPGTYPVEFDLYAPETTPGSGAVRSFYTASGFTESSSPEEVPLTVAGSITVAGEPIHGGACPAPLPEGLVTFALGAAGAAPGETGVSVPVSILMAPEAPTVSAFTAVVRYDPAVLGGVTLEGTRGPHLGDEVRFRGQESFLEPGTVSLSVVLDGARRITSESDGEVARLRFCVLEGAPPGDSPLHLVDAARGRWNRLEEVRTSFTADRGIQTPLVGDGSVTVSGDPRTGGGCDADDRTAAPIATFALGDASAAPGSPVRVPFAINSRLEAQGFAFSVDFDEEVLEAGLIEKVFRLPDGTTDYDFASLTIDNANATPGNAGTDEGFLLGGVIFSMRAPRVVLPPERDNEVLAFHFQVKPDASPGTSTELRFLEFSPLDGGPPAFNMMTVDGRSVYPGLDAAYVYLGSSIQIVGDVSIFIRGDANGDSAIDVSDARFVLDHLFLGGRVPWCADAADVNDDGALNIADPIHLLSFLFLGGARIPPPSPGPGGDPSFDLLADCP